MNKLWSTFVKDLKLSMNGLYFYMEIGMVVLFILIMLFAVPENFEETQQFHFWLDVEEAMVLPLRAQLEAGPRQVIMHDERESMIAAIERDRTALGVIIRTSEQRLEYELVLQGYESERMRATIKTVLEGEFLANRPHFVNAVDTRVLAPQAATLSDRSNLIPIYLTLNVGLMGLFIIAAFIFLDKDEGVIKAFAVTPSHIWQYLASKTMVMVLVGVVTSVLVSLALVGIEINYALLILAVVAFSLFGSTLGLYIASFFDSMSKSLGAMYVAMVVLMMASVSYLMPSFSPLWIRLLPTYYMLFSFRDILLADGGYALVYQSIALCLVLSGLLFALANARFKHTLTG